jgi:PAS domain S-box-containing protein
LATEAQQFEGREALAELTAGDQLPILLVDDREENLSTLAAVVEPLGLPVHMATSGYDALRMLLEREYALILLDVRMPGLDGLETARLIKSRTRTRDLPIVFLTAASDDVADIVRGYGVGAVDYVLKPFNPELLRSKVAVFAELERSRRAIKRSEALLRGAFEAAPIGKTVLDSSRRIVLANSAFARLLGREPGAFVGVAVLDLCHPADRAALSAALDRSAGQDPGLEPGSPSPPAPPDVDLRLQSASGAERWVGVVASPIEPTEFADPMLLIQWADLSARRRAEQARAELMLEHSARTQAEAIAERLGKLQTLAEATESRSLEELLPRLAIGLAELFGAELVEATIEDELLDEPLVVRAAGGRLLGVEDGEGASLLPSGAVHEVPLAIERLSVGALRLWPGDGIAFSAADRSLLHDAADRAALAIRRARLHEEEHRIAVELQRGLVPKSLPQLDGLEIVAHYQPAGAVAEVGGDWYDAFALPGGRLGVVIGDVAGKGIPAASTMGQVRSVTRAYALADDGRRLPGEVLTRLNSYQAQQGDGELFTVLYAIVDPRAADVTWASGGHLPPLLRIAGGETAVSERGDGLIGLEQVEYTDIRRKLGPGGLLVLYTDGLVERRDESLDQGLARLEWAAASGPVDPRQLCDHLLDRLLPDEGPHDDVTAVVVRVG